MKGIQRSTIIGLGKKDPEATIHDTDDNDPKHAEGSQNAAGLKP